MRSHRHPLPFLLPGRARKPARKRQRELGQVQTTSSFKCQMVPTTSTWSPSHRWSQRESKVGTSALAPRPVTPVSAPEDRHSLWRHCLRMDLTRPRQSAPPILRPTAPIPVSSPEGHGSARRPPKDEQRTYGLWLRPSGAAQFGSRRPCGSYPDKRTRAWPVEAVVRIGCHQRSCGKHLDRCTNESVGVR